MYHLPRLLPLESASSQVGVANAVEPSVKELTAECTSDSVNTIKDPREVNPEDGRLKLLGCSEPRRLIAK
jgi:hypothetical protein